ncbi:hypothetical protein [Streptomyces sp. NPDC056452]|uniref:hypothetical protein n=1 Tax=Streptomyces sp. NPDC056452 TaxID=3345821 RepID=UPI0036C7943B
MPHTNPYGQEKDGDFGSSVEARGWQAGYDTGVSTPPDVPETPSTRHPGFMDAWAEGAAAGNADGRAEGWRLRPVTESSGFVLRVPGAEPEASGESGDRAGAFAVAWKSVGDLPLALILRQFAPGAETGSHTQLAGRALDQVIADKGGPAQLYLPLCVSPPHQLSGDALLDAGYWHGDVSDSFDEAGKEATSHALVRVPHFSGLVRYRPVGTHNFWDWLPLQTNRPDEP